MIGFVGRLKKAVTSMPSASRLDRKTSAIHARGRFGNASRKALKSRTVFDLLATSDPDGLPRRFCERPFKNIRFALNWHASPDSNEGSRFTVSAWPSVRRLVRFG
jgi:hypothetical protein